MKAERKRFRQSLETTDKSLVIRTAEGILLDALSRQQAGQKVLSATLGEVLFLTTLITLDAAQRAALLINVVRNNT